MNKQKGFTLVELVTVLFVGVVGIGIGGGLLYTAIHFIAKFW